MDHDRCSVEDLQPDDLKKVAGVVWSDRQDARRVSVRFEIDDDQSVIDRVSDGSVADTMLPSRAVYLRMALS